MKHVKLLTEMVISCLEDSTNLERTAIVSLGTEPLMETSGRLVCIDDIDFHSVGDEATIGVRMSDGSEFTISINVQKRPPSAD